MSTSASASPAEQPGELACPPGASRGHSPATWERLTMNRPFPQRKATRPPRTSDRPWSWPFHLPPGLLPGPRALHCHLLPALCSDFSWASALHCPPLCLRNPPATLQPRRELEFCANYITSTSSHGLSARTLRSACCSQVPWPRSQQRMSSQCFTGKMKTLPFLFPWFSGEMELSLQIDTLTNLTSALTRLEERLKQHPHPHDEPGRGGERRD